MSRFEDMTLDEISAHWRDNLAYLQPKMKVKTLVKPEEVARVFVQDLEAIFQDMGMPVQAAVQFMIDQDSACKAIDIMMKERGITVECLDNAEEPQFNGLYFYKGNEIAHCIMSPKPRRDQFLGNVIEIWATV